MEMNERLQLLLTEKGMTAARLAEMMGVQPSAISHIISGRNKPGFDLINKILSVFPDISARWLLTGEGSIYTNIPVQDNTRVANVNTGALEGSLFSANLTDAVENKLFDEGTTTGPDKMNEQKSNVPASIPVSMKQPSIERIIIFFSDGSFKEYSNQ